MTATYDNYVEQIATSVFSTMMGIESVRIDLTAPTDEELVIALVHIAGKWTGSVVLALPQPVARAFAASMLQTSIEQISEVDQHEVASELVNMIGGNLKSMLPAPSFLSLPSIVSGRDFGLQVRDAELIDDVSLSCESGELSIQLFMKRCQ